MASYSASVTPLWNTMSAPAGASASSSARRSGVIRLSRCRLMSGSSAMPLTMVSTFLYGMNEPM
ncbi:hypothetical protein D3C85_1910590 [compost metagenome]